MGQIEQVSENVKEITISIEKLGESITIPTIPQVDLEPIMLTKEEIMIKILMGGGDMTGKFTDTKVGMSEELSYETVYGELQYNGDGGLLYPGVVNREKSKVDETHPMNDFIDKKKQEVKVAVKQLGSKTGEIKDASVQLGIEIGSAAVTIASSAVIFPPGSGIPVAFSAVLSIFSSLQAFQTKVQQILPFLAPLTEVAILIPETAVNATLSPINVALATVKVALDTVQSTVGIIAKLKQSLVPPPGLGGTPAESIELEISATETSISPGGFTRLNVNATKGSWEEYTYSWTADNDPSYYSTSKSTNVEPSLTTTYTVEVTDSNNGKSSESIIILVI